MSFPLPRFEAVTRRQLLQRSALAGAAVLVPAACSHDDESRLRPLATNSVPSAPSTTAATTVPATTVPATSEPASTVPAPGDAVFPAGAELQVDFTYQADSDRVRNPYLVVWVETPGGEMVSTISLWLKRDKTRYLDHLTRWYDVEAALLDGGGTNNLDTVAGATRGAGAYQVVWSGTDVDGAPVAQGDYVLCVEASREHGPHSFVSAPITIGTEAFAVTLGANAELVDVSADYRV
ncbi:MAG: DUF2271 domain-containing protein [Actinomycetota bacterium]|nr:DUF2271 domain-containing protein [Actinomycetota bacterium]